MKLEQIIKSPIASKKWRALWSDGTHTDFGGAGYQDYTEHRDPRRRDAYRARHAHDRLTDPKSPGALSFYLLWGASTSLERNLALFRRKFNV